ncbi:hypothetical protein EWB00_006139 [Schistosoma japonicum]|uniref:Uncharacterized protein n=1 Tax=Schistosoma japonicum TaxID=6182 RepID=A0A4Z2CZT7_SCHJA|nr:hypothetical protein EWB00_006139 [Schistosoma japonicum]
MPLTLNTDTTSTTVGAVLQYCQLLASTIIIFLPTVNTTQTRCSMFSWEFVTAYLETEHLRHMLKGIPSIADYKPLMKAFITNHDNCDSRETRQSNFHSQHLTDRRYIRVSADSMADALS